LLKNLEIIFVINDGIRAIISKQMINGHFLLDVKVLCGILQDYCTISWYLKRVSCRIFLHLVTCT